MRKFITHVVIFFIPLICFLIPSLLLFYVSGEFFKSTNSIKKVFRSEESLIGYAIPQNNYWQLKWDRILEDKAYNIWALGSSRVTAFRGQMFDSSFFNLGLMISTLEDITFFE